MDALQQEVLQLQQKLHECSLEAKGTSAGEQAAAIRQVVNDELVPGVSAIRHCNALFCQELQDVVGRITKYHTLKTNLSKCLEFLGNYQKLAAQTNILAGLTFAKEYSQVPAVLARLEPLLQYFEKHRELNRIEQQLVATNQAMCELKTGLLFESQIHQLNQVHYEIIEKLGLTAREEFIQNVVQQALVDYTSLFRTNQRTFSCDGIVQRINWFLEMFCSPTRLSAFAHFPENWNVTQCVCIRFVFLLKKDTEAILEPTPPRDLLDTVKFCASFEDRLGSICPQLKWRGIIVDLFDGAISSELCHKTGLELNTLFRELNFSHVRNSLLECCTSLGLACKSLLCSAAILSTRQSFVALVELLQKFIQKFVHIVAHECAANIYVRINTLSFSIELVSQLKDTAIKLVAEDFRDKIRFEDLAGSAVQKSNYLIFYLVRNFASKAEKQFSRLRAIQWETIMHPNDCSNAAQVVGKLISCSLTEAESGLTDKCDFYRLLDRMADHCADKYISLLASLNIPYDSPCLAGEQLLLDFQCITQSFTIFRPNL